MTPKTSNTAQIPSTTSSSRTKRPRHYCLNDQHLDELEITMTVYSCIICMSGDFSTVLGLFWTVRGGHTKLQQQTRCFEVLWRVLDLLDGALIDGWNGWRDCGVDCFWKGVAWDGNVCIEFDAPCSIFKLLSLIPACLKSCTSILVLYVVQQHSLASQSCSYRKRSSFTDKPNDALSSLAPASGTAAGSAQESLPTPPRLAC